MKKARVLISIILAISMVIMPMFTFGVNEEVFIYPEDNVEEFIEGEGNGYAAQLDESDEPDEPDTQEEEFGEYEEYENKTYVEDIKVMEIDDNLQSATPSAISFASQHIELDYGIEEIKNETVNVSAYTDLPTGIEGISKEYADKEGKFIGGWKDENGNLVNNDEGLIGKTKLTAQWGDKFANIREISDFTQSFKNMLKEREITAIELVIPKATIKITDSAFYFKTDCPSFSKVDFSLATELTYIGSNSFNGKVNSGDIIIPDSVKTIRYSAFMGCKTTGELKLPDNPDFTKIEYQTFADVPLTGTLDIPNTVTIIDKSAFRGTQFTGELILPDNLEELGNSGDGSGSVFLNCTEFSSITWPANNTLKYIGGQTFKGTNMFSGKLILPDSIETIVSQAFDGAQVEVVYMPKSYKHTVYSGKGNSPFYNCPKLKAVIFDTKAQYEEIRQVITSSTAKFTYEIDLAFDSGNFPSEEKLFGLPINMIKDPTDNSDKPNWILDSSYSLPTGDISLGKTYRWSATEGGSYLGNSSILNTDMLYADTSLTAPKVSISADYRTPSKKFSKEYDKIAKEFSVKVTHPLIGTEMEAIYVWYKASTRERVITNIGNTINYMSITDVDESRYGQTYPSEDGKEDYIECCYIVKIYIIDTTKPVSTISVDDSTEADGKREYDVNGKLIYSFSEVPIFMEITPTKPNVNPVVNESNLKVGDSIPAISLTQGDTEGAVTWSNPKYKLILGDNDCEWIFTPLSTNYTGVKGNKIIKAISDSSSGDSGNNPDQDEPAKDELPKEEIKISETQSSKEVQIKVESEVKNGEQSAIVGVGAIEQAIKASGENPDSKAVDIAIDLASDTKTSKLSLSIPKNAASLIANESNSLKIQNNQVDMLLSKGVLETIAKADGDIEVSVENIKADNFTPEIASMIGERPILDFKIKIGNEEINYFDGNVITLNINYAPKEGENPENLVGIYLRKEGGVEYVKNSRYLDATKSFEIVTDHFSTFSIAEKPITKMVDVEKHWAKDYIQAVVDSKLMIGIDDSHFAPDDNVTRAMAVCVLAKLAKMDSITREKPFEDVEVDSWYVNEVSWAKEKGYVSGITESLFEPDKNLSREECAVILANYLGGENISSKKYSDEGQMSPWAIESINRISELGFMMGDKDNNFNPQEILTRAELATIIFNIEKIN